jgi:dUTP pyrophosphatase
MKKQGIVIKIKRLQQELGNEVPLPRYMTGHSSGMDIFAAVAQTETLRPGERKLIPTGIALEIPEGYEGQVRPRSGLALRHGITLVNTPGTIDADYRGELGVLLINLGSEPFQVKRGDRIAQLIITPVSQAVLEVSDNLDVTPRSGGGFGHTG